MGNSIKIDPRYNHLEPLSRNRASNFFSARKSTQPHLGWMENRFLETLDMIARGITITKIPPDKIKGADPSDLQYFDKYENLEEREEHLRELGKEAIGRGELMTIDLVAGMATGFGGIPKGAVQAHHDARYEQEKKITYLDIKRNGYLGLQRECGHHIIAAAMVSNETELSIIKNLKIFAKEKNVELVLIPDGESREKIEEVWKKYKDKWNDSIIVPIVRQPSTLYISKDAKAVGEEYMKGHGDFYDVVKSQLKDIIEITGIKYIFSSNIDNTGAWISRSILGYFIEQVEQKKIEAIMEAAEKFEGDKGGAPAFVNGVFTILEEPFVPDEWKDRFLGRKDFPYFNTNTFWFTAEAALSKEFSLPLMITKEIIEGDQTWLKVESIMGHGLEQLVWKALVIDRGLRFLPAKYLTDLWIGRSDWMKWYKGRLMPVMRDGRYVPKPLVEISKKVFGSVDDLNSCIFGFGAYDSMKYLETMLIGGEGKHFSELGDYTTKCGVCFEGDVAIIFEYKEGKTTGTLVVQGVSESDEITLRDSIIFVPAGETLVIKESVKNSVGLNVKKEDFEKFLANATRWPESQKRRVLEKFFPKEKELPPISEILTKEYLGKLTKTAKENAQALLEVFRPTGLFKYEVTIEGETVYLKVIEGSKIGSAKDYQSKADKAKVVASGLKGYVLKEGDKILVYTSDQGFKCVLLPFGEEGIVLVGDFNEDYPSQEKLNLLKGKLDYIIALAEQRGIMDRDLIKKEFLSLSWEDLLKGNSAEVLDQILGPLIINHFKDPNLRNLTENYLKELKRCDVKGIGVERIKKHVEILDKLFEAFKKTREPQLHIETLENLEEIFYVGEDREGLLGKISSALGEYGVNIIRDWGIKDNGNIALIFEVEKREKEGVRKLNKEELEEIIVDLKQIK